jgi:leucyl-tRNA synthetase
MCSLIMELGRSWRSQLTDDRDLEFAKAMDLPIRTVVDTGEEDPALDGDCHLSGEGRHHARIPRIGLTKSEAIAKITEELVAKGLGKPAKNYRLRDWLISRQRFWGLLIPIVHCDDCGEVAVPESELPIALPDAQGLDLKPAGTSPLGAAADWSKCPVPKLWQAGKTRC